MRVVTGGVVRTLQGSTAVAASAAGGHTGVVGSDGTLTLYPSGVVVCGGGVVVRIVLRCTVFNLFGAR